MSVTITVDGRAHEAREGEELLSTLLSLGYDVPFFCWHGALGSVGACRQCAVRVAEDGDDAGEVVMACMTGGAEGQRVSVADPEAADLRAHVVEWLMLNHPHDCPTCEEAGSCHLQDVTRMTGHWRRRAIRDKRVHRDQWLGPLVSHEMNRCVGCYRCTRFYRHYAGGRDLDVFGAADDVYFGRAEDGALESPFAGNLAEVCPVGVFNDRGWSADYARKWDMQTTPSVCMQCSVGCNVFVSAREGRVRRVQNRYHAAVNGYFLCDRGRFGVVPRDAVSSAVSRDAPRAARLASPRVGAGAVPAKAAVEAAREAVALGAIGIGSPRATLEANAALRRLVGPANFFAGVSEAEAAAVAAMAEALASGPARPASLAAIERADAVLILGEDLTATAPRAALALRQAARGAEITLAEAKGIPRWQDSAVRVAGEGRRSPIFLATPLADALDDVATPVRRDPPGVVALGHAVARTLAGAGSDTDARSDRDPDATVRAIAEALSGAERPLVVAGSGLGTAATVEAAAAVAAALGPRARLALFPPEGGSLGLALLAQGGVEAAERRRRETNAKTVVGVEADLALRAGAQGEALIASADRLVALDWLETATTRAAHVAVPVAGPEASTGTLVNHEGRAQRAWAAVPGDPARPLAWRLLHALSAEAGAWTTPDDLLADLAREGGALAGLAELPEPPQPPVARAPAMASGRTADDRAGQAADAVPAADLDTPFAFSMEGRRPEDVPGRLAPGFHAARWTSSNAVYRFQEEVNGPLRGGESGVRLFDAMADETAMSGNGRIGDAATVGNGKGGAVDVGRGRLWRVTLGDPFLATEACAAAPLLAARAEPAAIVMHPEDAAALGLAEGARPRLDGRPAPAPLSLDARIARGVVGVRGDLADRRRPAALVRVEAAS
ncbi:MAG: 2Fe-2S iron-sulfur cluster-binding protein [Paracoccaceae bacterium]